MQSHTNGAYDVNRQAPKYRIWLISLPLELILYKYPFAYCIPSHAVALTNKLLESFLGIIYLAKGQNVKDYLPFDLPEADELYLIANPFFKRHLNHR
jgi:hypothetical protein